MQVRNRGKTMPARAHEEGLVAFNRGWLAVGATEDDFGFHAELVRESRMTRRLDHVIVHAHNMMEPERRCEGYSHLITIILIECLVKHLTINMQPESF